MGEGKIFDYRTFNPPEPWASSSIAGIITARICHDHFERVIIVEPEAWLATKDGWKPDAKPTQKTRARVMQYQSLNGAFVTYDRAQIMTS